MRNVISYIIKVKPSLINYLCKISKNCSTITRGKTKPGKSSKYKQTVLLWSSVLYVFNFSVQHFALSQTEFSSKICLGLDSCLELLRRECAGPTTKAAWPALWAVSDNNHRRASPQQCQDHGKGPT